MPASLHDRWHCIKASEIRVKEGGTPFQENMNRVHWQIAVVQAYQMELRAVQNSNQRMVMTLLIICAADVLPVHRLMSHCDNSAAP